MCYSFTSASGSQQNVSPKSQKVLPLLIKTANVYSGRIVSQKDDSYEALVAQMNAHYAGERRCAVEVLKGELYAIQEENVYNRY